MIEAPRIEPSPAKFTGVTATSPELLENMPELSLVSNQTMWFGLLFHSVLARSLGFWSSWNRIVVEGTDSHFWKAIRIAASALPSVTPGQGFAVEMQKLTGLVVPLAQ